MTARRKHTRKHSSSRNAGSLLTLSQVAERAGVSLPTALTYKRKYQDRLPSVGSGRTQRYKPGAVAEFRRIKSENVSSRGRKRGAKAAARSAGSTQRRETTGGTLSLAEISRRTRISYQTLLRYVKIHGRIIPSSGEGRTRRFTAGALGVFEQLRSESRRGRKPTANLRSSLGLDGSLAERIRRIEDSQMNVALQIEDVLRILRQPLRVTIRPE